MAELTLAAALEPAGAIACDTYDCTFEGTAAGASWPRLGPQLSPMDPSRPQSVKGYMCIRSLRKKRRLIDVNPVNFYEACVVRGPDSAAWDGNGRTVKALIGHYIF